MKKTWSQKSYDTVPLNQIIELCPHISVKYSLIVVFKCAKQVIWDTVDIYTVIFDTHVILYQALKGNNSFKSNKKAKIFFHYLVLNNVPCLCYSAILRPLEVPHPPLQPHLHPAPHLHAISLVGVSRTSSPIGYPFIMQRLQVDVDFFEIFSSFWFSYYFPVPVPKYEHKYD